MLGGVFSHFGLPDAKTRKGHFTVKIVDTSSPITQGITDFPIDDELYYQLQLMPDVQPPGHHRIPGHRLAGRVDPHLRQGPRVPHDDGPPRLRPEQEGPLQDPNLSRLVVQGVEWVAAGRMTPKDEQRDA